MSDPSLSTEPKAIVCAICGCTISKHGRYNDEWWAHDDGTTDHVAVRKLDPKPWVTPEGTRFVSQLKAHEVGRFSARFRPDPQYSQDLSAYENGAK